MWDLTDSRPWCVMAKKEEPSTPEIANVPKHIAIIMDGNGRWANEQGKPRTEGHRAGARTVREVAEACGELGVAYLTLYAFSPISTCIAPEGPALAHPMVCILCGGFPAPHLPLG